MISRFTRKWVPPVLHSCPIKVSYELITQIEPISFNEDKKTVKEYKENEFYNEKKTKWKDYIKSFDVGSPSEQIMNHLTKGTPLITAHTLPYGDYTPESMQKGQQISAILKEKGISLEQLEEYLNSSKTGVQGSEKQPETQPETESEGGVKNA